jgi:hypothetical protein
VGPVRTPLPLCELKKNSLPKLGHKKAKLLTKVTILEDMPHVTRASEENDAFNFKVKD